MGKLKHNVDLSDYVSWRSSGVAKQTYQPDDLLDLQNFLSQLPGDEPLLWIGLGSNLLVREGGFSGTVILTQKTFRTMEFVSPTRVRAEVGVACPLLARFTAKQGLSGGEWFCGIPGSLGGALTMNAGAFGGSTWNHVVSVETIDRQGELHTRVPTDFHIAYREVSVPKDEWFLAGIFEFSFGDPEESFKKIHDMLDRRSMTQPTGVPTCGSVFRNPTGDYAARLIEASGLKGYRVGPLMVSDKHANFIVNLGGARPSEIEALVQYVSDIVFEKQGIRLVPEVKIVGASNIC